MYKCEMCSSTFTWKDNLQPHIKTHKVRRAQCKLCNLSFKYNSALKRHEKNVHLAQVNKDVTSINELNELKTEMLSNAFP